MNVDLNAYKNFVSTLTSQPSRDLAAFMNRLDELDGNYQGGGQHGPDINVCRLLTAGIGLSSETGEFNEIVKKIMFQGKELSDENVFQPPLQNFYAVFELARGGGVVLGGRDQLLGDPVQVSRAHPGRNSLGELGQDLPHQAAGRPHLLEFRRRSTDNHSADPRTNPDAVKLDEVSHFEVLQRGLQVMDSTAITFCMDNRLPIVVFDVSSPGNIGRVFTGEPIGTLVHAKED